MFDEDIKTRGEQEIVRGEQESVENTKLNISAKTNKHVERLHIYFD